MSDPHEQPGITGSELAAGRERAARRAAEAQAPAAAEETEHDPAPTGDGAPPVDADNAATPPETDPPREDQPHPAEGQPDEDRDTTAPDSGPDQDGTDQDRPRTKRGRKWVVRGLIVAVIVLIGWDVAARMNGGGNSPGTPEGAPSSQSSRTTKPAKKDLNVAVTFETKSSTQHAKKWCHLVSRPQHCINALGDTPPSGLTKPVRVLRAALVPGRAAHNDGSIATKPGTPEVAAVLTVQSNHDRRNIKELVLVRTSDHKVIATELIGHDQGDYTPAQLAGRILAGHESDAVTW